MLPPPDKFSQSTNGDAPRPGYRLYRLSVLNWGTFHQKVWQITPGGDTALLTGANGSGKSTLVDALLTLLVPNQKRNYNKASGSERRAERNEESYILGAYGKVKSDLDYAAKTQYLRTKDDYAILLAEFCNAATHQIVSLAQIFWMQNGGVQKFFVVGTTSLTIEDDLALSTEQTMLDLKKRLKTHPNVRVFDQFNKYSRYFRKQFGKISEKAFDLFNQTVTIKEVGDLNTFVRDHMLEKEDADEKIDELRHNYHDLTRAYEAIERAQQQLDLLQPLMKRAEKYKALQTSIETLRHIHQAAPAFFAERKLQLLDEALQATQADLDQAEHHLTDIQTQLADLRRREREVYAAISQDEASQQLRNLERDMQMAERRLQDKRALAEQYSQLAQRLELPAYSDEATFYESRQRGQKWMTQVAAQYQKEDQKWLQIGITLNQQEEIFRQTKAELNSLKKRKSQIPAQNVTLREQILKALQIPETDIPFVGELLQVKGSEKPWRGAVERLLHSFGLRLLVPERYYQAVSRHVNETNLRGRLVFHRVDDAPLRPATHKLNQHSLFYKLDIQPETIFYDWLRDALIERYNYVCCDGLDQFRREQRAITLNGMLKRGHDYHEKDDRFDLHDRRNYILGWNNLDKIKDLEEDLATQASHISHSQSEQSKTEQMRQQLDTQRSHLQTFLGQFEDFNSIDWRVDDLALKRLQLQYQTLQGSSNRLQALQTQLETVQQQIKGMEGQQIAAQKKHTRLQVNVEDYQMAKRNTTKRLNLIPLVVARNFYPALKTQLGQRFVNLDNIDAVEQEQRETYFEQIGDEERKINYQAKEIEKGMQQYKNEYPTETTDVDDSIEALGEYERMLKQIEEEDLPQHQQKFKALLDEKVIQNVVLFNSFLEDQEDTIRRNIETLNESLANIDYTESTFIQLAAERTRDVEIREFREMLKACYSDVGQLKTADFYATSFEKVKPLIERFEQEERWTAKVTDVRNWLNFSASERYKSDGSERHYYSDSSGKSGGQKAKLAYTILASAIAYQYGLDYDQPQTQSFRFVVVDEAFSKSDEANARYAMDLFDKLNLQLLVVTPLDKIHVVEPYIAACHFVSNTAEENNSRVVDMTIAEYQAQKEAFLAKEGRLGL